MEGAGTRIIAIPANAGECAVALFQQQQQSSLNYSRSFDAFSWRLSATAPPIAAHCPFSFVNLCWHLSTNCFQQTRFRLCLFFCFGFIVFNVLKSPLIYGNWIWWASGSQFSSFQGRQLRNSCHIVSMCCHCLCVVLDCVENWKRNKQKQSCGKRRRKSSPSLLVLSILSCCYVEKKRNSICQTDIKGKHWIDRENGKFKV